MGGWLDWGPDGWMMKYVCRSRVGALDPKSDPQMVQNRDEMSVGVLNWWD